MELKSSYPEYNTFSARILTFRKWPHPFLDRDVLAHAGFFSDSLGDGDGAVCFHCGVKVHGWFGYHDPITRHAEVSPSCLWAKAQEECLTILKNPIWGVFQHGGRRLPESLLPSSIYEKRVDDFPLISSAQENMTRKYCHREFQSTSHMAYHEISRRTAFIGPSIAGLSANQDDLFIIDMSMTFKSPPPHPLPNNEKLRNNHANIPQLNISSNGLDLPLMEKEHLQKHEQESWFERPRQISRLSQAGYTSEQKSDSLCSTCANLDFKSIFAYPHDQSSLHWRSASIRKSISCAFCQLIRKCFDGDMPPGATVRGDMEPFATNSETMEEGRRLSFSVMRSTEQSDSLNGERASFCVQELGIPSKEAGVFSARWVDPHRVDLALVSKWVSFCERHHGQSCVSKVLFESGSFTLRVIDVLKGCVVEAAPHCRYIALSYVWGDFQQVLLTVDSLKQLNQDGALFAENVKLPATIQDAIMLCQKLGERYLWVDSLCIIQDNVQDKHAQISHMDSVYRHAALTIIGAGGTDCNSGLSGVRPRQLISHVVKIGNLQLITVQRSATEEMFTSKWNHRAWTLQERALSKRLLVFTSTQVFFYCAKSLWTEDVVLESTNELVYLNERELLATQILDDEALVQSPVKAFTEAYADLVTSFVNRELSREDDALDAFSGICRALSGPLGPFIWALPSKFFGLALLWHTRPRPVDKRIAHQVESESFISSSVAISARQPTPNERKHLPVLTGFSRSYSRRRGFPSWSWTGWKFQDTRILFPSPGFYDSLLTYYEIDDMHRLHCFSSSTHNHAGLHRDLQSQLRMPPNASYADHVQGKLKNSSGNSLPQKYHVSIHCLAENPATQVFN
jgi:hypothetical protein